MPAGPVGAAVLAQVGKQSWENPTDLRVIAGEFWGITGTQGAGERENWATALEFRVPLLQQADREPVRPIRRLPEHRCR